MRSDGKQNEIYTERDKEMPVMCSIRRKLKKYVYALTSFFKVSVLID